MCRLGIISEEELAQKLKLLLPLLFIVSMFLGGLDLVLSQISCVSSLHSPIMVVAGLLAFTSLLGIVFVCSKKPVAISISLFIALLVVVLHLSTIVVTYAAVGGDVRKTGYWKEGEEYRIEDYSRWLREKVDTDSKWNMVRSCEVRSSSCKVNKVCAKKVTVETSPIKSGCCKPPTECGFRYQGGMVWDKPAAGTITSNNTDCAAWGNDRTVLCYGCQSCKAAVLAITKRNWENLSLFSIIILAVYGLALASIFTCECNASRRRRRVMHVPEWKDTSLPVAVPMDIRL